MDELILKATKSAVEVTLEISGSRVMSNVFKAVPVRVRVPVVNKDMLDGNMMALAILNGTDQQIALDFYIKCRTRNIEEEILEIRKSMKRISRYMESIDVACDLKCKSTQFD